MIKTAYMDPKHLKIAQLYILISPEYKIIINIFSSHKKEMLISGTFKENEDQGE